MKEKIKTILLLINEINNKSETIGQWQYYLRLIDDWSSPKVTIGQNNIKSIEDKR
jgi:hypothetical protein